MIAFETEHRQQRGSGPKERGAGLAEYSMLLALIAAVVLVSLGTVGPAIANLFDLATAGFN